jgi:high-affinity iron transporter
MNTFARNIFAALLISSVGAFAGKPELSPQILDKGKAAYAQTCQTCHGDKGDGMGPTGKYLNPKPRDFSKPASFKNGHSVDKIFDTFAHGLKGTGMSPYDYLPEADRWAIAYYVQSFAPKAASKAPGKAIAKKSK